MAASQVVNAQLAAILAHQASTAALYGDADRIAWWQERNHPAPQTH